MSNQTPFIPKESERNLYHVAFTKIQGQEHDPPLIQVFNPGVWHSVSKQSGYEYTVLYDPNDYLREQSKSKA
jgi:hypothetical protein